MNPLRDSLLSFQPWNAQESTDRDLILSFIDTNPDAFLRSNATAHMTASSWVVNHDRSKVLMVYHRIYNSWSWTGGHADGCRDLLSVAMKECMEETGVQSVFPLSSSIFSLEVLTVDGHEKHGFYISSHLHMNLTYLLEADENEPLHICEEENQGVRWFGLDEAVSISSEPWFRQRIYSKLNAKLFQFLEKGA